MKNSAKHNKMLKWLIDNDEINVDKAAYETKYTFADEEERKSIETKILAYWEDTLYETCFTRGAVIRELMLILQNPETNYEIKNKTAAELAKMLPKDNEIEAVLKQWISK